MSVVEDGRAAAESLMVDACAVTRPGAQTLNETTGVLTTATTAVYAGKCRVKAETSDTQTAAGDRATMIRRFTVSLPMAVTTVAVDDVVTITTSALDAGLPGMVLVVNGAAAGSQVTARRLACVAVTN